MGGLGILLPVYVGKTPEEGLIAKIFCHAKIFRAVNAPGRTIVAWHFFAGGLSIQFFYLYQFFLKSFR